MRPRLHRLLLPLVGFAIGFPAVAFLSMPEPAAANPQVNVLARGMYLQSTYCVPLTATPTRTATPVTATATLTNTPPTPSTPTNTPTATATPRPGVEDLFEDNDSSAAASWVSVQATNSSLTFCHTADPNDVDWYKFDAKAGNRYEIETAVDVGLDTYMELFLDPSGSPIAVNDDKAVGDLGSKLGYTAGGNATYYLRIVNRDPTNPVNKDYSLTIRETPPEQIIPGSADSYEPNYDFAHAALIGSGASVLANFVPWPGGDLNAPDNDFYKIYAKSGVTVTCETSNLGPGTDTNMILYDSAGNALGGNDDIGLGNYASRVSVRPAGSGNVFVLVGQAHPLAPAETPNLTYTLICNASSSIATPTPAPTPAPQAYSPPVPTAPPTPSPTATQTFFGVRAISTPVRPTQSLPIVADFEVLVYFDADRDREAGSGEGVRGMAVELRDRSLGVLLARGFTDDAGRARLTATAFGDFELWVPYLNLRRTLSPADRQVPIQILGGALPLLIP